MHENVDRISSRSVTSDDLQAQRILLDKAERKLARMDEARVKIRERISELREQLAEARSQHSGQNTIESKRALMALTKKLNRAVQRRDSLMSEFRELKLLVRDQRALYKSLVKKDIARQKAVAMFLKEWERNYDRETRMQEKNIRKRQHMDKT
jgi:predicted  nucleic acid-binding Zn-ribbon protein